MKIEHKARRGKSVTESVSRLTLTATRDFDGQALSDLAALFTSYRGKYGVLVKDMVAAYHEWRVSSRSRRSTST